MDKQKILIADDEIDNVILLEKRLKASGFDTLSAHDGNETVVKALAEIPDLVLLDIMMPGKDGYAVLKVLRENESTKNIPVIMLTAKAETIDKVKGLELGAEDYVTKPFDYKELLARINSHLESKREVEQQIRVEKLVALSTMMEGVAHEVRNPLVVIGGFSKKLIEMTSPDDPRYPFLKGMEKEVARLEKMIRDIYEFKTLTVSLNEEGSVNGCVSAAVASLSRELDRLRITVNMRLSNSDAHIQMNREQLIKALRNIIINAAESMPSGGTLTVTTSPRQANGFLITLTDTGCGIKPENLKFIFDPFFTSKMEGVGIGLTMALKIIQAHNGTIAVKSEKDTGTTVTVELFPQE